MLHEDLHHLRAVGRPTGSGIDYMCSFAEIGGAHYRRAYDGKLFHIRVAEVIKAVHRASRDAQRLPRANLATAYTKRSRFCSLPPDCRFRQNVSTYFARLWPRAAAS